MDVDLGSCSGLFTVAQLEVLPSGAAPAVVRPLLGRRVLVIGDGGTGRPDLQNGAVSCLDRIMRAATAQRGVPAGTARDPYNPSVPDAHAIAAFLQHRLDQIGLDEVPAVEAAAWLDDAGLLNDSPSRPGLPLRNLLRAGEIPAADQRPPSPNGKWFIVRDGSPSTREPSSRTSAASARSHGDTSGPPVAGTRNRNVPEPPGGRSVAGTPKEHDEGAGGDTFTRAGLVARGFVGFERFKGISLERVPAGAGVYVVLREKDVRPAFLDRSPAGWFKGRDPTVDVAELEVAWPDQAHCVYIGKADVGSSGRRGLRKRISEFRQYGDGRPVGHQGGRRIWQLGDADDYVIAWLPTIGGDPAVMETELIRAFVQEHGKRPIGNRAGG